MKQLLIFSLLMVIFTSCKKNPADNFYNSSDQRSFEEIWEAYKVQVGLKVEGADFKFNPPANLKEVSLWEKTIGIQLTGDLLELYKVGNGQAEDGQTILKGFTMMKVVDAARQWQLIDTKIAKIKLPEEVKGPVKKEIWNPKWIPFAVDPGGNFICVDMTPDKGGYNGQIIAVYFESGIREVLAPSLKEYFSQAEKGLKEGKLGFDAFGIGPIPVK